MDLTGISATDLIALGAMAVLGFFIGRVRRKARDAARDNAGHELKRAVAVAQELERITQKIDENLSSHRAGINSFKEKINALGNAKEAPSWKELGEEAESMIRQTLRLAGHIAHAYAEIRQQSNMLLALTEVRTDPLTGLNNRRMLDESLTKHLAMLSRYEHHFSIAMLDIDYFKKVNDRFGHVRGDQILQQFAKLLEDTARETDIVVRYGGEEFAVIMPETNLENAGGFAERVRRRVEEELSVTVSAGVATALETDNQQSLLERADEALYAAKSGGRNQVHLQDGQTTTVLEESAAEPHEDGGTMPAITGATSPAMDVPAGTVG